MLPQAISIFDMLKIGVGPSSSHTLGPWRAIQRWQREQLANLDKIDEIEVILFGSLALTGKGHCTDTAICLALLGYDPETIGVDSIARFIKELKINKSLQVNAENVINFDPDQAIKFYSDQRLPEHPNAMTCRVRSAGQWLETSYFSVGGGFIVFSNDTDVIANPVNLPFPAQTPNELLTHCEREQLSISALVRLNELAWRNSAEINSQLDRLWHVMKDCIWRGSQRVGTLPGGLSVSRRAAGLQKSLLSGFCADNVDEWIDEIKRRKFSFSEILRWVSCFALAVNEENASLVRVVTAPTNGAAGVIPAVLMYHICFSDQVVNAEEIRKFLIVAGEVGTYFKKGATISAAMGGCQAEIGVSSAMAAAALTESLGGTPRQVLIAAEIAIEHHLGMTCDPVAGLVQIPCIERNAMGAVKAVNAAQLALAGDPYQTKVTLDAAIKVMADTARDMHGSYKETSQGGLAVVIPVALSEC